MSEPWLLAWSAPDEHREERLRRRLYDLLAEQARPSAREDLEDLLEQHRDPAHPVRGAVVVGGTATSGDDLAALRTAPVSGAGRERLPRPVALMLDGHGAQHIRMGAQLYGQEPVFTAWMDRVFDALDIEGV
ncbi:hypothetical protein AB0395_44375, partial [Streptosporangium sp. NPDC051023]